jgi:hypothetical protein
MDLSYDLPIIKGDIASFANLSQIVMRPKSVLTGSIAFLEAKFPEARLYHFKMRGEIDSMLRTIGQDLAFPHDVSHSLDAFVDMISDLSWLGLKHLIIIADMTNQAKTLDQCMVIDALSLSVTHLNIERRMQLSVVVILQSAE